MDNKLNIYQKLVLIKSSIKGFHKDVKAGNENYGGYEYVSGSQVLRAIKDKMNELGVLLIPDIDYNTMKWQTYDYITSKGKKKTDFIVTMKMTYSWVNAEFPDDRIVCNWVCMGQQTDDISKAVGTAISYNERYFLLKFLGLPTDEDDADAKEIHEAGHQLNVENKWTNSKLSDAQIKRLFAIAYKAGFDKEKIKSMVMKQFNKEITSLNKTEYDRVCDGLQAKIDELG